MKCLILTIWCAWISQVEGQTMIWINFQFFHGYSRNIGKQNLRKMRTSTGILRIIWVCKVANKELTSSKIYTIISKKITSKNSPSHITLDFIILISVLSFNTWWEWILIQRGPRGYKETNLIFQIACFHPLLIVIKMQQIKCQMSVN